MVNAGLAGTSERSRTVIRTRNVNIEFVFKSKSFIHSKSASKTYDRINNSTKCNKITPKRTAISRFEPLKTKLQTVAKYASNPMVSCAFDISLIMES